MRALVVDNNAEERATVMTYLCHAGYSSIAVSSVNQAYTVLEDQVVDLLLLELHLPDGNGFQLCNEIRERLGNEIIILFVSHLNTSHNRTVGIQLGADDFLGKPCSSDELLTCIYARQRRRMLLSA